MAIKRVQKRVETETEEEIIEKEEKTTKARKKSEETEAFDKEFPFGIGDLCEAVGDEVDPRAVRRFLRTHEVEKAGKRYGWKTQDEVEVLAEDFLSRPVRERKPKPEKEDGEEVGMGVKAKEEAVEAGPKPKTKIRKKEAA